jgi:N-acetylglutamate synthase-like GNAT family acetyltransferase
VEKQSGLQKRTFVLTTTAQRVINMSFLENLEFSMADDDGMPSKSVTEAIKEMLEDPEHHKLMERLKYMEDNGI